MSNRYVVAFAGARDAYQVPLALQETQQLECLVTDAYGPNLPGVPFLKRFARRSTPGLPIWKTRSSPKTLWLTHASWRFARDRYQAMRRDFKRAQDTISREAGRVAMRRGSNLLLYAGYARVAFTEPELRDARKILFMYHPHIRPTADLLAEDAKKYPEANASLLELEDDATDRDIDVELELADLVLCASEFTASTVCATGIDRCKVVVVPYGIDLPQRTPQPRPRDKCRFLFVGSAIHRKGLHILLESWQRAALPDAELTLICRAMEPWLAPRANVPGIIVRPGVPQEERDELYSKSTVFVLPSLVEGFGYVYLEALASGCYCIGTENTGLPDLHLQSTEGEVVKAGDVGALTDGLRRAHELWRRGDLDPTAMYRAAARWSWPRFRTTLAEYARNLAVRR